MKTCNKCKKEKPLNEFAENSHNKKVRCLSCKNIARVNYYVSNKEKIQEYQKIYKEKNPKPKKEGRPKLPSEYNSIRRKRYYYQHPEKQKAYTHTRRVKGGKKLSPETINILIDESDNICFWCNEEIPQGHLHIDHIYPVSKGGKNDTFNLVVSCRTCNLSKGSKDPEIFLEEILAKNY